MGALKRRLKKLYHAVSPSHRAVARARRTYQAIVDAARGGDEEQRRQAFRSMPPLEGDAAVLRRGNLLLLRLFDRLCREHEIPYFMVGGTLLGAVRHGGFIPWDDDIDVGMTRENIERLQQVVDALPELRLQPYCNNRDYNGKAIFSRVIKLTLNDDASPFWIDVLCYDWAGDPERSEQELWAQISAVRQQTESALIAARSELNGTYWDQAVSDPADRARIDGIYAAGLAGLPGVERRDYLYRSVDCLCGSWQRLFPAGRMLPFAALEFEGLSLPAPKDYEWYLRLQFGDYLSLPDDIGQLHIAFSRKRLKYAPAALKRLERLCREANVHDGR